MLERLRQRFGIVRALCVALLLFAGMAHQPMAPMSPIVDFAAYRLPDNSVPAWCGTANADGKTRKHDPGAGCEVCRLSSAIDLPAPSPCVGLSFTRLGSVAAILVVQQVAKAGFPPGAPPRGPPVIV